MSESDIVQCSECGGELPPGLPRGLCPRCALLGVTESTETERPVRSAAIVLAHVEPAENLTADQIYERRWAQTIFTDAMNKLRAEYERRGEIALFDQLKELQPGKYGECSHADIGARLGMSAQAVSNAALNFRRRYAWCLRQEVARTVQEPWEVEEELGHLIRIFRG